MYIRPSALREVALWVHYPGGLMMLDVRRNGGRSKEGRGEVGGEVRWREMLRMKSFIETCEEL